MKLLQTEDQHIITALGDRAFVTLLSSSKFGQGNIYELVPITKTDDVQTTSTDDGKEKVEQQPQQKKDKEIQAVTSKFSKNDDMLLLCAVSRYDKSLSVYSILLSPDDVVDEKMTLKEVGPNLVHRTKKRSSSLVFSHVSSGCSSKNNEPVDVIIAGDLAGDVITFPATGKVENLSRHLLGHTASTLTSVKVVQSANDDKVMKILTSDRDEKVRISSYPDAFNVEGYLLGHTAYISSMDVIPSNDWCVTCSGDGTVKLWDYEKCIEIASIDAIARDSIKVAEIKNNESDEKNEIEKTRENEKLRRVLVPVGVSAKGNNLAVVYDGIDDIHIFIIVANEGNNNNKNQISIEANGKINCSEQPLAASYTSDGSLFVLMKEPSFIRHYSSKLNESGNIVFEEIGSCSISLAIRDIGTKSNMTMPLSVLEMDETTGKVKLEKANQEGNKGFVKHEPWLNVDRVEIAKEAGRRRKRRLLERQKCNGKK